MTKSTKQRIPGGFVMVPKWVFAHPELTRTDREVYAALAFYADNKERTCYPSVQTIMWAAKCSNKHMVHDSLKRLESAGAIEVHRRKGFANVYHLPKRPGQ